MDDRVHPADLVHLIGEFSGLGCAAEVADDDSRGVRGEVAERRRPRAGAGVQDNVMAFTDENTILPEYLLPEQVRQTVATAHAVPAAPTPAARRNPPRRPPIASSDNVVSLKSATRRTASSKKTSAKPATSKPKKAAVTKHRKPGLVKPA